MRGHRAEALVKGARSRAWRVPRVLAGWVDDNLEYTLMNVTYTLCTLIVFSEAVRRYLFRSQAPWAPHAAIYLFIWLSWLGCAYNVKTRSHIRFDEIRRRLPYTAQFVLQLVDYAVWILLGGIVSVFAIKQIMLQATLGSLIQGTDHVPIWIAFVGVPFGWGLVICRSLQAAVEDVRRFRAGKPFAEMSISIEEVA